MGMTLKDLADFLKAHLMSADDNLKVGIKLLSCDPFNSIGVLGSNITGVINSIAISLTVLFFMIDFCNKAMLIKVNTPEEIFKLIFRIFIAKEFVTQAPDIMAMLYNGFNSLVVNISSLNTDISIMPNGIFPNENTDILLMFLDGSTYTSLENNPGIFGIFIILKYISLLPTMLIIWIATLVVSVVLVGRLLEVIIYTAVAPIPLSTLASEGTHDIAKNFIKNYCAVCLQAFVLIAIFSAFSTITTALSSAGAGGSIMITLSALALAGASAKSGSIAKTICGC